MDATDIVKQAWPFVVVAAPGLWALWRAWRADREADRHDRADLVRIAQEAAGSVIEDLREDNDRLRDRLDTVEREFGEFRRTHDTMIAGRDAELAMLRGENRELKAMLASYERLLEANQIPHEKPAQPFWLIAEGGRPPTEVSPP